MLIRQKLTLKFHSKKIHALNQFQKIYCLKRVPSFVFCHFNIISYIFPGNFIEIHSVSQEILIYTSSTLTIFVSFLNFLTSTCYKTNDVIMWKKIWAVSWLGIILDRLLKNCIKLDYIGLVLPVWRLGVIVIHPEYYLRKAQS